MDEDYRDGLTGAPPREGADMGKYYMGQSEFLPRPPTADRPPTRSRPRPPKPPITASGWLLGLAIWLALIFGVLHWAGVDTGFVVDPVSRLVHDLARAVDDRLGS